MSEGGSERPTDRERGPGSAPALAPAGRRWVLVAATLGSSMVFLDNSTVNVALPALQRSLGASVVDVQWVINAYTLFLASLLLIGGALGDQLGSWRSQVEVAALRQFVCGAQVARHGVALVVAGAVRIAHVRQQSIDWGAAVVMRRLLLRPPPTAAGAAAAPAPVPPGEVQSR